MTRTLAISQPSRLGRLYTYAKGGDPVQALENFTTEALAIAVEDDDRPMCRALRAVNDPILRQLKWDDVAKLLATTQVYLHGAYLDLALLALSPSGNRLAQIWVEVKTDAPLSGDQLDVYRAHASQQPIPSTVITLNSVQLDERVPNLSWLDLYQAARRTHGETAVWRDLRKFLEEQMITSDALGPISDVEAGALGPAYDLLTKASAVLQAVHESLDELVEPATLKRMKWKNVGYLNSAASWFRQQGEFQVTGGPARYGLAADQGVTYWFVAIVVHRRSAKLDDAVAESSRDLHIDTWKRFSAGPTLLMARARATGFETHQHTVKWIQDRLLELDRSGTFAAASR